MGEKIAKKVLAIAKEREEQEIQRAENRIRDLLQQRFDLLLVVAKPWEAVEVDFNEEKGGFEENIFIEAASRIGVKYLGSDDLRKLYIPTPEYEEVEKSAWIMLQEFNVKLAERQRQIEKEADAVWKEISDKLNDKNFDAYRQSETEWLIVVSYIESIKKYEPTSHFLEKLRSNAIEEGFNNVNVEFEKCKCQLVVEEA